MTKLNKALMATTAIAFASGLAMPASAQDPTAAPGVVKSSKKMKLKLYGQITRAFGVIDDGASTTFKQSRNGNTSTRMGIDGRGKISKNMSLRTRMEYEIRSGDFNTTDSGGGQTTDAGGLVIRHLDAIFSHKRAGAVWIGRGDTASNGTSEKHLLPGGHTGRLGGRSALLLTQARVREADGTVVDTDIDDFFDSFDGFSRRQRIRYDTPTFGGVKLGVSAIDRKSFDLAMHYSGKVGGVKVKAGAGFGHAADDPLMPGNLRGSAPGDAETVNQLNGSLSFLLPMGLGFTFSGGRQWINYEPGTLAAVERSPYSVNGSIWFTRKFSELGPTGLEYSIQFTEDQEVNGDEGTAHSLLLTQVLANTGTDTFVTFRYFDVERVGFNPEPLWFFGAGFRARF